MKAFWQRLGRVARVTLAVGVVAIFAVTAALAVWAFRADYEVLFGNLSAQDAAAMTAELDRMKLPYRLGADGTTILVDKASLHQTRLKLMSRDIPLHGAVGFELFNNTDFGMTEFAQKVNYQRALQGEITRTILSLSEVESVRVHLAFPEEGLFKRDQGKAKAAVTLALKHGQTLQAEQVKGIQRLVSASVSGINPQDVTIVDQNGIALTRMPTGESQADVGPQLELKREIEQHLASKASRVLDQTFGAGVALASVDVVLDMSQVRVTTEDVTGPAVKAGEAMTGVIVRERETTKEDPIPAATRDGVRLSGASSQRDIEYQVGRRVEQVVSQPGSIRRLQVLAVIKKRLDAQQVEHTKAVIAAAVGSSSERGDVVVVQSLSGLLTEREPSATGGANEEASPLATHTADASTASAPIKQEVSNVVIGLVILLVGVLAVLLASSLWRGRRAAPRALSPHEREAALERMRDWIQSRASPDQRPTGSER